MELTERYSIAHKGLKSGRYDFGFTVDGELFRAYDSPDIVDGACDVAVRMERGDATLSLDVSVTGHVVVPCDRCLENCSVPVDFEGRLLVRISDEQGEYDGETMWISPADEAVDLSQYIYESIVLSLPYQRVHPDGECDPEMMKRFRIVSGEEFAAVEAQAQHESESLPDGERAKLAALRERMNDQEE